MKTLLNIGGSQYLIPRAGDVSRILDLLQGMTQVKGETLRGPEGELEYNHEFYRSVDVLSDRPQTMRVELVHDEDVVTREEFSRLEAAQAEKIAAWKALQEQLPKAASVARAE